MRIDETGAEGAQVSSAGCVGRSVARPNSSGAIRDQMKPERTARRFRASTSSARPELVEGRAPSPLRSSYDVNATAIRIRVYSFLAADLNIIVAATSTTPTTSQRTVVISMLLTINAAMRTAGMPPRARPSAGLNA